MSIKNVFKLNEAKGKSHTVDWYDDDDMSGGEIGYDVTAEMDGFHVHKIIEIEPHHDNSGYNALKGPKSGKPWTPEQLKDMTAALEKDYDPKDQEEPHDVTDHDRAYDDYKDNGPRKWADDDDF